MTQGFDTIYVYTDVVESRIVGDSIVPLLCSLPIRGNNIHYVTLLRNKFGTISIDIRDDIGRSVPFEYGKVTVKRHVRWRKDRTVLLHSLSSLGSVDVHHVVLQPPGTLMYSER